MPFKSPTQPHCIYCSKKIRKYTDNIYCWGQGADGTLLRSKDDAQRQTNLKVVSVSYMADENAAYYLNKLRAQGHDIKDGERVVSSYSTWDGESYVDQFFCNGSHAQSFAYRIAHKYFTKKGG